MNNFKLHTPTRILFGKGAIVDLRDQIPQDARVLITYGGGSVKKTGVLAQVQDALKGLDVREFGGIEPNPSYETLMKAVQLVRDENITFLLAVGGGSVLDGTKFIAAAQRRSIRTASRRSGAVYGRRRSVAHSGNRRY
ncbi:putative oxidoreductase YqhD [Salmonella enterica subsp. enterica serovar Inverness str. R8-3668]|uniref:Putative oxidoreductase YqhD n=1 Tax=Salmonella enterica subsp. enterica serovar Inverness str. R8-3668 TaxID=913075 RepID=G5NI59_SALET|nr:putative oxidoreductase YqhD [Salmonella enterica subsp. enterica serovar Inverness str. R8-3668]